GSGVDTLVGTSGADTISITGNNSGTVGSITFSAIENLDGQAGNDRIVIANTGTITGNIEGGGGTDTLDYSAYTNDVTLDFKQNNATAVNNLTGIESFIGGDGNDTFILNQGVTVNSIDGGAGSNTINGDDVASVWDLTGADTGNGTGVANFSNIQNLLGGNQSDHINFLADGAQFTDVLDGGDGALTLSGENIDIGTAIKGTNELIIQPLSTNRDIQLGGPDSPSNLTISTTELTNINNSFTAITIGHPDGTGTITLGADVTLPVSTTIQSPNATGSINTQGFDLSAPELRLLAAQGITTADLTAEDGVTLIGGDAINTQNILTSNNLNGGDVFIESDNTITIQQIDTESLSGTAGNVTLNAAQDAEVGSIRAVGNMAGGNVDINVESLIAQQINTRGLSGAGGDITLTTAQDIEVDYIQTTGNTVGGNIDINADSLTAQQIDTRGLINNGGNITVVSSDDVEVGNLQTTGNTAAGNVVIDADSLTAQQINTVGLSGDGGNITVMVTDDVAVGDLRTAGNINGGDITILDADSITTQQIDTTSLSGTGGNVTLSSIKDIEVDSIRAEGNTTGGNVDITTNEFFRATDNFTDLDGMPASISTAAFNGTGSITIRHTGNGATPFKVGDGTLLGSHAALNSGEYRIEPGNSFLNSHTLGNISILTQDNVIPPVVDPPVVDPPVVDPPIIDPPVIDPPVIIIPSPISTPETNPANDFNSPLVGNSTVALEDLSNSIEPDTSNKALFERLENSYSEQFKSHLNLYERVSISSISLEVAQQTLNNVESLTGVKPGVLYVYFLPADNKDTAIPDSNGLNPDDELGVLLLTHNEQAIRKKIDGVTRGDVMKVADDFSAQVTNVISSPSQYLPPAQQLYEWFIAPIEGDLQRQGVQSLALAMDTGLRTLPMAALHNGEEFLIERYSLGLIPSFSLTDFNSQNFLYTQLENTQLLAMGASQFPSQPLLPAVPEELDIITKAFNESEVFLNEKFTLNNLQSQVARNEFGIIHLASHGVFEPGEPRESYIQLWDQPLRLDQVHTLGLQEADIALMVLSACNTALGNHEAEYGFAGLAVNAGVQTSVASLWPISDEGTLGLMTYFYEHLQQQPVRAKALRQAQLAMMRGELAFADGTLYGFDGNSLAHFPELEYHGRWNFKHPFYWSTYTLVGSPW
ncbi:MAG: CHAT domain-containing protein, partial [Leptolyngbyaceae cyanobacterium MAG.088]|nr:CHAT domain-containing protein [Leptolyngbyaceae cyanobacterium MAG.088]